MLGARVEDSTGERGTVRYVGPVATAKDASALYYGIEWDAWGRGKNDGSVELPDGQRVVHFAGPAGRKSVDNGLSFKCSFVKKSVFDKSCQKCSSLLQRLRERYGGQDTTFAHGDRPDVTVAGEVGTTLGSEKPIELVGAKKLSTQQTLQTIEKISLSGCQISELGEGDNLMKLTPKLTELDLSRNLFRSWGDIFDIVKNLPLLETLVLSNNRFVVEEEDATSDDGNAVFDNGTRVFDNVKVLVLNQTLLSWQDVGRIVTRHFPKLEQLHLVDNEYEDDQLMELQSAAGWFETLEVLNLSMNRLSSWKRVLQVVGGSFVNLTQLLLNDNRIVTFVTDTKDSAAVFQKLTTLSVSGNLVDSWTSIDALNAFPQLDTLRLSKNPLTAQMSVGEARMLVVARTDRVAVFNASPVREKERQEAEQLYLKRILHELAVIGDKSDRERVLAAHPRYARLRELYPEISIESGGVGGMTSAAGPRKLASSLIKVSIVPMSMKATSLEPLVKKIPQQMKVSQLKLLIETKFGVEVPAQVLSFRSDSRSIPMLLDDDSAEVSYYGMQNGSEVLVNDNE
ncbi:hypothetical protein PF005_g20264 [Phytophthora fragariae]|uniref:Ubiquitin-like domain-containing protein n=1 Tax=Phytophthora fragariae TaxID=53985 RepID=A0A6A3IFF7_9STRA|nr:hypothetical protein PF003_g12763 [Phytophthora fragariae]KAE8928639.1 hypothetical protein PF009_g21224 [Phytophthora fragariae]KAE8979148.1 hypothetical protein PF011_g22966 [Phytophthora fragariae]KAE9088542.1 hypothetical protein PF007_g19936 [Phytophthora fragariae]KAE9090735.1 hypothetical protein PF010_g18476 [Phytophthora fragariae]